MASSRADLARRLSARKAATSSRDASRASTFSSQPEEKLPINLARRDVAVAVADYEFDSDWDPISDGALHDSITEDIYTGKFPPGHRFSPKKLDMKRAPAAKQPSLADALRRVSREDSMTQSTTTQITATFNARNTRFSRQTSSHAPASSTSGSPVRKTKSGANNMNPPTQSTSLLLPNLPNVTEMVSRFHLCIHYFYHAAYVAHLYHRYRAYPRPALQPSARTPNRVRRASHLAA